MLALSVMCALSYQLPMHSPVASRIATSPSMLLGMGEAVEGKVPATTGEAKVAFNSAYGRPVGGMQQGFVNELLTSIVLTCIRPSYQPSRVFYLGITSLCDVFFESLEAAEAEKLYTSLCAGCGLDGKKLKSEADKLVSTATGKSEDELFAGEDLSLIASAGNFKYSYPLGAGILKLMELAEVEPTDESIERWCSKMSLPSSSLQVSSAQQPTAV